MIQPRTHAYTRQDADRILASTGHAGSNVWVRRTESVEPERKSLSLESEEPASQRGGSRAEGERDVPMDVWKGRGSYRNKNVHEWLL